MIDRIVPIPHPSETSTITVTSLLLALLDGLDIHFHDGGGVNYSKIG